MVLNLQKGAKFNLVKAINKIRIGAGWDVADVPGVQFDLDLWVLGLSGGKLFNEGSHAVVYANMQPAGLLKKNPSGQFMTIDESITHTGDNRNGSAADIDEAIDVDLNKLPAAIDELSIFISIYEADARKQTFGNVNGTFVRVNNLETGDPLCQYDPHKEFGTSSIVQIASIVRDQGTWTVKAIGQGAGAGADINTVLSNY